MDIYTTHQAADEKLGEILRSARHQSLKNPKQIASDLKITEFELKWIENCPSRTPLCKLSKVMCYYGDQFQKEVELALVELQINLYR